MFSYWRPSSNSCRVKTAVARGWRSAIPVALVAAISNGVAVMSATAGDAPLVIAHRGASGYLPEHTLEAKALAHAQGADFIEQDVVLTRDGVAVVLHDIHLDSTTDVALKFPERAREDGRFYAIDFTLDEVKSLSVHERRRPDGSAVYPNRFPVQEGLSEVPTLEEEIRLLSGLNQSTKRHAGLYIEMKGSAFHKAAGLDLPAEVLKVLRDTGWDDKHELVFLQSFEPTALLYLKDTLGTTLPLIQLIGENAWREDGDVDFEQMCTDEGLAEIASYAQGIGPWVNQLYLGKPDGEPAISDLVSRAKELGLLVHPYTLRADDLPDGIDDFEELHRILIDEGVDGFFSDFPDQSRSIVDMAMQ